MKKYLLLMILFFASALEGGLVQLGPTYTHMERTRSGGSGQSGQLKGFHASYESLQYCGFYWGVEGYYAKGTIDGKKKVDYGEDFKLKSDVYDSEVEGRLGYTLPLFGVCVTPYVGGGRIYTKNRFKEPSPVTYKMYDKVWYASGGMIVSKYVSPCLGIGVYASVKYMVDGENKITDNGELPNRTLSMNDELQYSIEVPLSFNYQGSNVRLVPFYRWRHYGAKANKVDDTLILFATTKYRLYGVRLMFTYCF